jgi:hypothetical protein
MIRPVLLTAAVAIGFASSAAAQIALPVHLFPVTAKLAGAAGTDWMSSLSVSNVGALPAEITVLFFRENQTNIPLLGPSHELTLLPGATVTEADVLGSWFPSQGNTKGFLVLLDEAGIEGEDPFTLVASQRIFNNANPAATYGQTVPSSVLGLLVAPATSTLPGARTDDAVRSNVGVLNFSLFPLDVLITTFDAEGAVVASVSRRVPGFSLGQWSMTQLGVAALTTPGRVEVVVDPDSITWDPCLGDDLDLEDLRGVFMAYLSRVDQATGDAEFILGQNDWGDYLTLCGEPMPQVEIAGLLDAR